MSVRPIQVRRVLLKEFTEAHRHAFVGYHTDERYRRLYDLDDGVERPNLLFDLFRRWQDEAPRSNFQLGLFHSGSGELLGCGGLRGVAGRSAVLGVELAPDQWGRYRLAVDAVTALLTLAFDELGLQVVTGETASGNRRVEKLARWFGAELVQSREGPAWMRSRGWREVDWSIDRDRWRRGAPPSVGGVDEPP